MAETQVFDQVKAAGDAIRKPAYVNVFAPGYKPLPGPTARGFQVGLKGAKAAAGGLAAIAGDVTGVEPLRQYGLGVAERAAQEAAELSMPIEQVDSVGSAVDFAKYAVGHTGGNLLTLLAGGALGRVGGAAIARGVPAAAEKLLVKNAGMTAGMAGTAVGLETGSIYPDAIEAGVPDPVARSVLGGAAAGALDLVPAALLANKLGLFGRAAPTTTPRTAGGVAKGVAKGAAVQAPLEGVTEVAQSAIARGAAGKPLTGDEAFSEFLNAGALGAIGGGVFGGVAGGVQAATQPVASPAAAVQPPVATPPTTATTAQLPAADLQAPPLTPFQAAKAADLALVQEPDRMALVDTSPSPATETELQLIGVQDRRKEVASKMSALAAEEQLPKGQRRAKQDIVKERRALDAEAATLAQRESNLQTLVSGPEYQPKTTIARPTIIGEQPAAPSPAAIITPEQDAQLRVAEQEAQDAARQIQIQGSVQQERIVGGEVRTPAEASASHRLQRAAQSEEQQAVGAQSVQTRLALTKRAAGQLLTADEATAVRQFEATAPAIVPVTTSSRGVTKQPSGKQARENFVATYTAAVDRVVDDLAAQTAMAPNKSASLKSALKRASEKAVQQPDAETAQQVLNDGFSAALKGKLPAGDVEVFSDRLAKEVMATAPQIVNKQFSKAAVEPTDTVVFSHWGDVPGGRTDPAKMGTGVRGADWAAANAVGLSYTSAVVRGSAYTEPAVQSRTPYTGVLQASRVYQADRNDPLLAEARQEIAPQFGPDENIAWAQYAKKVRDLGYDAIQYANGQLRVFTPQEVYAVPTKQQLSRAVSVVSSLHAANGGATYNVVTGQDMGGTQNYAVSSRKDRELVVPGKTLSAETLRKYVEANDDLLSDPRNVLGTWFNEADGNTYVDISTVSQDMQSAMRFARAADQLAIFDLRTFTTIPVEHDVFNSAQAYAASIGLPPLHDTPHIQVDPELGSTIARVYDTLQARNDSPEVMAAYEAFATEIEAQYNAAAAVIKIEPWTGEGQPYANSAEMRADVFGNNHMWVFEGGEPHPFLTQEQNTKFRAVHDIYGHAKTGFEFGPRGELNASRAHAQMFSPAAVPALVTETIGQNSWVNFSEANAGLPADQRAFAEQKADLLPEALWRPLLEDGARLQSRAAARTENAMAYKGVRMLEALEAIIGTPARVAARVVNTVEGGTGVIRFGQARDVIELSLRAKDGTSLAAHEGYHYLEQRVLGRDEKAVIARAFKRGSPAHTALVERARAYDKANGTNITDEIKGSAREAHAYGFEFWQRGELTAPDTLTRVWQKIMQVLERVANMVRGNGFQSHEDIFRAIKAGHYARRESNVFGAYAPEAMSRGATRPLNQTDSPEFKMWFGDSKVVDADGKPLVVYHGTNAEDDFGSFDSEKGGVMTGAESAQMGHFFTDNPAVAAEYAGNLGMGRVMGAMLGVSEAKQNAVAAVEKTPAVIDAKQRLEEANAESTAARQRAIAAMRAVLADAGITGFEAAEDNTMMMMAQGVGDAQPKVKAAIDEMNAAFDRATEARDEISRAIMDEMASNIPQRTMAVYLSLQNPKVYDAGGKTPAEFSLSDKIEAAKAAGHDGVIFQNIIDPVLPATHYVAFEPTQIKSAVGNSGRFDPADPNILMSRAAEGLHATWTDTRVDSLLNWYAYAMDGQRSKAMAGSVNPIDFLNSTTPTEEARGRIRAEATQLDPAKLKDTDAMTLWVDTDEAGNVIINGHEGRHRMVALANAGVTRAPVVLKFYEGATRAPEAARVLGGQQFGKGQGAPLTVEGLTPIAYDYRGQLIDTFGGASDVMFSQAAAADSLADMSLRVAAGELPRTQLNMRIAEILDDKTIPVGLKDKLFDPAADEFKSWGGSAKRFLAENINSGQHLSRKSAGYRNVFGTLTTYVQRKSVLIADAVEKRLSTWVRGASKEDKVIVSAALLRRTENAWATTDPEYQALRSDLSDHQREMFDQATSMIASRLDAELVADTKTYRKLLDDEAFNEWYENRHAQVEQLKAQGYFPERRFGDHVVHAYVATPDGKKVTAYFTQHEREADARRELDELQRLAGDEGLTFEYGYRYRAEYDGSISFGQFLTAADRAGVKLTQPEKERIGKALISADSTRRNRVFRRQNVAGYSQDGMRVLAEFGVTMANKIAYAELGEAINDALAGRRVDVSFDNRGEVRVDTLADSNVWEQDGPDAGFYRNLADETTGFVLSPREGSTISSKLRGAATAYFLGGSIAAGMVNMTALPMVTVPWLTQHTTYTDAMAKVLGAAKIAASNFNGIKDLTRLMDTTNRMDGIDDVQGLRHALQVAAQDGTILDTEIYELMGLSRGQEYSMTGIVQKAVQVWMTPFRLAEQMNRMATFIAAYKVAAEKNVGDTAAYAMAQDAVYSTQFRYDDANRPALARGDWGSVLLVFKSYPIFVLETLSFLARENPRAAAFMIGSLVMTAGIQGLPFAEDLEDLIDTIAQRVFGSSFNTERWIRNMLKTASEAVVGVDMSSVMMHGLANSMTEMNFASRVGLGNLIPGSRIGTADADYKSVMTEIIGPVGSMVGGVLGGADALNRGEFVEAARKALPLGAQNLIKGAQQWNNGFAADIGGRKLVDVSGWEAFWQSLGMSSAAVADAYNHDRIDRSTVAFYTKAKDAFTSDIVKGVQAGDAARVKDAVEAIKAWNASNPDMPMSISASTVRQRIAQAGMTLSQRTLMSMPKELRGTSEAALGLGEED
ncbi:MAG: PLxRFG domain-containing protein [Burkholderiales bacterium]